MPVWVLINTEALGFLTSETGEHVPMTRNDVGHDVAGGPLLARGLRSPLVGSDGLDCSIKASRHHLVVGLHLGHAARVDHLPRWPKALPGTVAYCRWVLHPGTGRATTRCSLAGQVWNQQNCEYHNLPRRSSWLTAASPGGHGTVR